MMSIFLDSTIKQFPFMKHVLLPSDKVTNSIMVRRHWPEEQVCPIYLRIITSNLCIETRETEGQEQTDSRVTLFSLLQKSGNHNTDGFGTIAQSVNCLKMTEVQIVVLSTLVFNSFPIFYFKKSSKISTGSA
jgi:hypothetical protein